RHPPPRERVPGQGARRRPLSRRAAGRGENRAQRARPEDRAWLLRLIGRSARGVRDRQGARPAPPAAAPAGDDVSYFRATDPFPLESAEHTKLHEFYARLAAGRLATTRCGGCKRLAWPPRAFCGECGSDAFDWVDLSGEGTIHAFTIQEGGVPSGFAGARAFAIVKIDGLRVFSILVDAEPAKVAIGQAVRVLPLRVADDPNGNARWRPPFRPA